MMNLNITNTKDAGVQKKSYLIFGATKTGKTLLSATLPSDDLLLINTENNLDSLYGADIKKVDCYSYKDFMDILGAINSGAITPKWLYLDSISDLMTKIFNNLKKEIADGRQVYAAFEERYGDIMSAFKQLPCNIVVIARQTHVKDEITGGMIYGAALPWAKLQSDLPFNFSAVLATRHSKGDDDNDYYSLQCHPCPQYQVGVRTQFGKPNPLSKFEPHDLEAIHSKIVG